MAYELVAKKTPNEFPLISQLFLLESDETKWIPNGETS